MHAHHYKPPDEFLRAVQEGVRPPAKEYFDQLREFELEWAETAAPPLHPKMFRVEKIGHEPRRVEVPYPLFLDES